MSQNWSEISPEKYMRILCFSGQKSRPQYQCDRFGAWLCPFPSARRHPSYGDCLEVKREYFQNSSVLDCVTQCLQSAAHSYEQFLQVQQIGFVTLAWDPYLRCVYRRLAIELYYCNMVEWFWWDSSLISTTNWFPWVL